MFYENELFIGYETYNKRQVINHECYFKEFFHVNFIQFMKFSRILCHENVDVSWENLFMGYHEFSRISNIIFMGSDRMSTS